MTIIYACSMDHYGAAAGSTYDGGGGQPAGWDLDNDIMLGDGWSALPSFTGTDSDFVNDEPRGLYSLGVPSFGARRGDRALIAQDATIYCTRIQGSTGTLIYPQGGGAMLAIPGATQATRIIHLAFGIDQLPDEAGAQGGIIDFHNGSGEPRARLMVNPSGRLVLYDGTPSRWNYGAVTTLPTVLLTSQAPVIAAGQWYSLNIVITNNGDTGDSCDVDVYVGDILPANKVLTGTGLAFSNDGNIDLLALLPASIGGETIPTDGQERAVRDIVICDTSGSYNNEALGQVFVSAQEMRAPNAGGGWGVESRENFSEGILDSVTTQTGVRLADVSALDVGTQDFTLETMLRFNSIPDASLGAEMDIIARWRTNTDDRSYRLYYDGATGSLKFDVSTDGLAVTTVKEIPWDAEKWKWYHVAVSRWTDTSGTFTSLFVNGAELGVPTADVADYYAANAALGVAARFNGTSTIDPDTAFDGWMDETRVTIGTGRYTAPFTPPTETFGRTPGTDAAFANVVLLMGYDGSIADEGPDTRTIALAASNPLTAVSPGDNAYAYSVLNQRPAWDDTYVEATNYFAQSILTLTALPTDGETITIGAQTYTLVDSFDTVATDQVLIGADVAETLDNLTSAINGGTGEGAVYGTGTTANAAAVAVTYASPQLIIRALAAGANTTATTETLANGYFDNPTLTGGTDIPDPSDFAVERLPVDATGVLGIQVTARASKSDAGSTSMRFDLVGPAAGVDVGDTKNPDLSPGWLRQVFEEDPDTSTGITPSTVIGGRIRFKRVT